MEAPAAAAAANQDVAPAVTPLGSRDDESNMAYARRCVVMEIIKAETDYVTHLHDVVQVKNNQSGILHRVSKMRATFIFGRCAMQHEFSVTNGQTATSAFY